MRLIRANVLAVERVRVGMEIQARRFQYSTIFLEKYTL